MKTLFSTTLLIILFATLLSPVFGQNAGQIAYEVTKKIDQSDIRVMINGEAVKPGDPNFPVDIPDTRSFGQKVLFTDKYAKEIVENRAVAIKMIQNGGPGMGVPKTTQLSSPFEETSYIDLAQQQTLTYLTVGKDKEAKTYRAQAPIKRAEGWQLTEQTKKIAGYLCRKATVPFQKETYTVWFTTELPITYSPVRQLTPERGVVLLIESSREQFRATKVSTNGVASTDVTPGGSAQAVTEEQLKDLRDKARADFQQKLMMNMEQN
jgi:GLPGLI family protein